MSYHLRDRLGAVGMFALVIFRYRQEQQYILRVSLYPLSDVIPFEHCSKFESFKNQPGGTLRLSPSHTSTNTDLNKGNTDLNKGGPTQIGKHDLNRAAPI